MRILVAVLFLAGCGADDPPNAPAGAVAGVGTISTADPL